jgi:tRNA pseudouridine32 synthase/23S rRNA pseudouridine746 synthase
VFRFEPQPAPGELPARFPSPFGAAHPIARRAAEELRAALAAGVVDVSRDGKMFGVLVVRDAGGTVGYLRAFSGMIGERWEIDGFAPPVFDVAARDAFWPAGEAELGGLDAERVAHVDAAAAPRAALAELDARHAAELEAITARHRERRAARAAARERAAGDAARLHVLAQASRADTAERRRLGAAHAAERAPLAEVVRAADARAAELEAARAARSRELLARIWSTYVLTSASGRRAPIDQVFVAGAPPGGAADCAGPKLLAEAYRRGLRPIALAELWWGPGERREGAFYPACRGKCGVVLPWMLDGLPHDPAPVFGDAREVDAGEPRTIYEDRWLVVVDKPCGLLSVPGRSGALSDSVLTRLRRRYPDDAGAVIVHRLDLDTSGVLLAARDPATHAALQRMFALREIEKRYVAWLAGDVGADAGEITLPLRVDVDDRPRQIHDPVHGKPAVTTYRVLAREAGRTRVALVPHTGRTHQLRVHAAHPGGLGAPIVGDRLYGGGEAARLMLHAEALRFVHPHTREVISIERRAPF